MVVTKGPHELLSINFRSFTESKDIYPKYYKHLKEAGWHTYLLGLIKDGLVPGSRLACKSRKNKNLEQCSNLYCGCQKIRSVFRVLGMYILGREQK